MIVQRTTSGTEETAWVQLDDGRTVAIDGWIYQRLVGLGLATGWYVDGKVFAPRRDAAPVHLARLIVEPATHQTAEHRDGDILNLRKANLFLTGRE